jgi:hypothetical protein
VLFRYLLTKQVLYRLSYASEETAALIALIVYKRIDQSARLAGEGDLSTPTFLECQAIT